jgi:hypothetical protein
MTLCTALKSPLFGFARNVTSFCLPNRDNASAVVKRFFLQIYTRSRAQESHFLVGPPDKESSWPLVAKRPFPLVRASGVPQRRTGKSWVLGKPPISCRGRKLTGRNRITSCLPTIRPESLVSLATPPVAGAQVVELHIRDTDLPGQSRTVQKSPDSRSNETQPGYQR